MSLPHHSMGRDRSPWPLAAMEDKCMGTGCVQGSLARGCQSPKVGSVHVHAAAGEKEVPPDSREFWKIRFPGFCDWVSVVGE